MNSVQLHYCHMGSAHIYLYRQNLYSSTIHKLTIYVDEYHFANLVVAFHT